MDQEITHSLMHEYLTQTTSRGVMLLSSNGLIVFVNDQLFKWLGCSDPGAVGEPLVSLLAQLSDQMDWRGPRKELFLSQLAPIFSQEVYRVELFFSPDNWLQFTGRPMESGGYVLTLTDVTSFHQSANAIRQTNKNMLKSLADVAENRDHDTGEHVLKVARLTHEMALDLKANGYFTENMSDSFLSQLGLASMLHDVGKVAISDSVLLKPGSLTPEERTIMQGHASAGFRIIRKIQDLQSESAYFEMASAIALYHHEKYAGGGYPQGLFGDEIPLEARIVGVSDVFDALTSWRPYKEPWSEKKALEFIHENSAIMFDPRIVQSLDRVLLQRRENTLIHWDLSMSVGHGEMDKDHRILIDLLNQLGLAKSRADPIIMDFVLDELYNYTVRHFRREEAYMLGGGFSDLDRHKRVHSEFSEQISDMRRQFARNADTAVSTELMMLLGTWLRDHILGMDQAYQNYFNIKARAN
ncbi:MAG: bacteriohemerythrin [Magnetococcales bacterium]|nr:bacteriohemerythrin [Magnetococcales bacterium]